MPANPNKRRCQKANCRNWAMRDSGERSSPKLSAEQRSAAQSGLCRAHRNPELGSGPVGAPKKNINALKTAVNAQPLSADLLRQLAHHITDDPHHLHRHLAPTINALNHRAARDPVKALLLLRALINQLLDPVAAVLFTRYLQAYLDQLPSSTRPELQAQIWKHALPLSPVHRVLLIRAIAAKLPPSGIRSAQPELRSVAQPNSPKPDPRPVDAVQSKSNGKQSAEKQSTAGLD